MLPLRVEREAFPLSSDAAASFIAQEAGCVFLWLPIGGGAYDTGPGVNVGENIVDVITNTIGTLNSTGSNGSQGAGKWGRSITFVDRNAYGNYQTRPDFAPATGDFWVLLSGTFVSVAATEVAFSNDSATPGSSGGTYQWRLQPNYNGSSTSAGGFSFLTYDGSFTNAGASSLFNTDEPHTFLGVRRGTTVELWRDGILVASTTSTVRNVSGSETQYVGFGWGSANTLMAGGERYCAAGGLGRLTPEQAALISARPWALFQAEQIYMPVAAGAGASSGDGSSSGTSTVSGVGASLFAGAGSSSGTSTVAAVGASKANGDGASTGTCTATAVGASTAAATGSSSGVATATAVGISTATADGASAGVATCTAVGASTAAAVGASDGTSTVTGVGTVAGSAGDSSGTGTVSGVGASTADAAGDNCAGAAAAAAVGASTADAVGDAAGSSTAAAVPVLPEDTGDGASSGTGTATGVGASLVAATGLAAGTTTALGVALDEPSGFQPGYRRNPRTFEDPLLDAVRAKWDAIERANRKPGADDAEPQPASAPRPTPAPLPPATAAAPVASKAPGAQPAPESDAAAATAAAQAQAEAAAQDQADELMQRLRRRRAQNALIVALAQVM